MPYCPMCGVVYEEIVDSQKNKVKGYCPECAYTSTTENNEESNEEKK